MNLTLADREVEPLQNLLTLHACVKILYLQQYICHANSP